jgi:hypothetical protein
MLLLAAMRGLVSQVSMNYRNETQLIIRTIRADKENGGIGIR